MPPQIRQIAHKAVDEDSHRCKAYFTASTLPNSLIVAIGAIGRDDWHHLHVHEPQNFERAFRSSRDDIEVRFWYREASPSLNSVQMYVDHGYAMQLVIMEITGAALSNALDKANWRDDDDNDFYSGSTGFISEGDEIVIAAIANQYASVSQSSFSGGLARLTNTTTPWWDSDYKRNRLTTHAAIATSIGSYYLRGKLSSWEDWAGGIVTFKSGITGPARFTASAASGVSIGGRGSLTVFGPLKSHQARAALTVRTSARIAPYNYQYRINGWNGLLIGSSTKFHVEGTEGLYGWQIRTSDDDLPRSDGALRGIDLVSARQVLFKLNVGKGRDEVERNMEELYRWLVPQRDEDWELIWRHPGQPLKMMRCRPIDLLRDRNAKQLLYSTQSFVLRAADPRHYSAVQKSVIIPNSTDPVSPNYVAVRNEGNSPAYPVITINGPSNMESVQAVELVNFNGLYRFDVRLVIPSDTELIADMEARVTGAPRSIITLNNQSKYGAWQLPREPFRLEPAPAVELGDNILYMRTTPANSDVTCTLTYRDTWSG